MNTQNIVHTKSILITGCSTGIGRHCAEELVKQGWRVFATARRDEDLTELASIGCEPVFMEMWSLQSLDDGIEKVLAETNGRVDAVFHNAAYGLRGALEDTPTGALRAQLECNLLAWHHLSCRIIPVMRKQGYGRIILNSSILGFLAIPMRGAYTISKYALEGWADSLRLEVEGSGLKVILIEPGPIRSDFRLNALKAYKQSGIDPNKSFLKSSYESFEDSVEQNEQKAPFELGPEAVYNSLLKALESKNPKIRYPVTFPTKLFGILKRLITTRLMDSILRKL